MDTLISLDHGILNIPLRRRGNIDAQIDRYKATQRKIKLVELDDRKEKFKYDKQLACQLLEVNKTMLIAKLVTRVSKKEAIKILIDLVKCQPRKLIILVEKLLAENKK